MRFPSKVTSYKVSTIALFPVILIQLEKKDLTPSELYKKVKKQGIRRTRILRNIRLFICLG